MKMNFKKLVLSLFLIAFVSTAWSFVATGNAKAISMEIAAVLLAIGFVKGMVNGVAPKNLAFVDGFVITDTTYAGEAASQFITKAITGADTINGGHVYVKDGIKKKFTIPRWDADYEDFIQDRAATPTSKGEMDVTGKALTPADYMIYTEFNPRDFEDHWYATQLNPTLLDRSLPMTVESVVVQEVLKRHMKYFNKMIWNGDTGLSTIYKYFNGFIANAVADADVIDVSTPITLTAGNVAGEFDRGYALIPTALRYDDNMKYFVSYATYDLYHQYQIAQTYKGIDVTKVADPVFKGKQVVKIADFPDNCYMIAKGTAGMDSNLWVGLNSVSDEGLQLQKLQNNSELYYIKLLMKADVQIGWGAEVVLYKA